MRTATSIQYSGTNAEASVVSPSTASTATRRPCRGIRLVRAVSGVDVMTTVKANTDMSSPMNGSATPRPPLISGSRPVGSISIVMDRKTPAASMSRPGQGSRGARTRADSVTDMQDVSPTAFPAAGAFTARVDYALMCAPRAVR